MTKLLIDVGNSRLKWALAYHANITQRGAQPHHGDPAAAFDVIAAELPAAPTSIWFANVAGAAVAEQVQHAAQQRWLLQARQAQVIDGQGGLQLAYAQPQRLGVDRWLMMQALWMQHRQAFVVVSAGTALTFDAVDAHGRHLGGVIAPGLTTMQTAVLGATRFAAAGPDQQFDAGLGADTEAGVRQGALHACVGLIDRLASRHAESQVQAVLTGGDAAVLAPHLASKWTQRPDLVLEGLLALAAQLP
ncbi:MAG: type pantothenate kinase [Nevskia sp.]|nr:type pantothenate kinase [Nevskia sp.]